MEEMATGIWLRDAEQEMTSRQAEAHIWLASRSNHPSEMWWSSGVPDYCIVLVAAK